MSDRFDKVDGSWISELQRQWERTQLQVDDQADEQAARVRGGVGVEVRWWRVEVNGGMSLTNGYQAGNTQRAGRQSE